MTFNLYFAGKRSKREESVLTELNVLRLLSFHTDRNLVIEHANNGRKLFLDSGAFSAHTKGAVIDVDEYINFINEYDESFETFAQLDTIPGEFGKPKTKEQLEEAPELSWQNYLYMYDRLKSPKKLQPIFHQGEDFKHLDRMLNHEPKIEYIGLSPANDVSTPLRVTFLEKCFSIISKSKNPNVKTHAYGMTSLKHLEYLPLYSADSTTWLQLGINGFIRTDYGNLIVSDTQRSSKYHLMNQPKAIRDKVLNELEEKGFDIELMRQDTKERNAWNIHYLKKWADEYELKKKVSKQNKLF